jgi:hypothetical protein
LVQQHHYLQLGHLIATSGFFTIGSKSLFGHF